MALDNSQKKLLRAKLFNHLDGVALTGVVHVLNDSGILDEVLVRGGEIGNLTNKFSANEGYLNVSLRLLCSQGWLTRKWENRQILFTSTSRGEKMREKINLYTPGWEWMQFAVHLNTFLEEELEVHTEKAVLALLEAKLSLHNSDDSNTYAENVRNHLEGILMAPFLAQLGIKGCFSGVEGKEGLMTKNELRFHDSWRNLIAKIFVGLNWADYENDDFRLNETGIFFAKRCSAYGVTVSYLQTFCWLNELLFGDGGKLWTIKAGEKEIHVDRTMNVWGSGGAHKAYFEKIDQIIIDLFNKPLNEQPKGIADMGCGNGAFLLHLNHVVRHETLRGKHLDTHPLLLIGSDFNQAAIDSTRENFKIAKVQGHVIKGDIGNPDQLSAKLKKQFEIDLEDMLNVRSFLDHNRLFNFPYDKKPELSDSTGAFSFRGKRIPNDVVEQSLREHLLKWKPYVKRFGLLIIELHTINPDVVSSNLGKTAVTAYDATHGFTDQYIIESSVFDEVVQRAGLKAHPGHIYNFPNDEMVTVSIRHYISN